MAFKEIEPVNERVTKMPKQVVLTPELLDELEQEREAQGRTQKTQKVRVRKA